MPEAVLVSIFPSVTAGVAEDPDDTKMFPEFLLALALVVSMPFTEIAPAAVRETEPALSAGAELVMPPLTVIDPFKLAATKLPPVPLVQQAVLPEVLLTPTEIVPAANRVMLAPPSAAPWLWACRDSVKMEEPAESEISPARPVELVIVVIEPLSMDAAAIIWTLPLLLLLLVSIGPVRTKSPELILMLPGLLPPELVIEPKLTADGAETVTLPFEPFATTSKPDIDEPDARFTAPALFDDVSKSPKEIEVAEEMLIEPAGPVPAAVFELMSPADKYEPADSNTFPPAGGEQQAF